MISYADFANLDIRIGTITAAERVPHTDKLLKLTVDFGPAASSDEPTQRTIVSGIAEWYAPEALVGKQAPFVINLEPRTLRGVVSQGMILAAAPGDKAVILKPHKKVPAGTRVK